MLENLVVAVESESQIVDLGRVSGFMQKVCFLFLYTSLYLPDLYISGPRWHHLIWCCRRLFIHILVSVMDYQCEMVYIGTVY